MLRDTQDVGGAIDALERAIRANPDLAPAREELADLYRSQQRFADEMTQLTALASPDPGHRRDIAIALAQARRGEFDSAEATLSAATTAAPHDSRATMPSKAWNINKIALCYRRLGNDAKALEYYLEAEKLDPEDLLVQVNLAHIYFDNKGFEKALNIYFKIEYQAPENKKIQRPIAWCSFMLGKLEVAKKYFEKSIELEGSRHDLLILGHIEWCLGNKQKAIECYKQSILMAEKDFEWFAEEFIGDGDTLTKYGIDPVDISLMRDYLKIVRDQGN